jgi:hypothetical protein
MAVAVVVAIGFLLMLWLVLSTVRRLRPGTFRFQSHAHQMGFSRSGDALARGCLTTQRTLPSP